MITTKVTNDYIMLIHKAFEFAELMEYDTNFDFNKGIFIFYNSPIYRSFDFRVIPDQFNKDPAEFLNDNFNGRY